MDIRLYIAILVIFLFKLLINKMIHLLGYVFFVFAGLIFGLFGSGGSIIIIPILIYIFEISIYEATTYSLLLVFLISLFGTVQHVKQKNLQLKKIISFIIPLMIVGGLTLVLNTLYCSYSFLDLTILKRVSLTIF